MRDSKGRVSQTKLRARSTQLNVGLKRRRKMRGCFLYTTAIIEIYKSRGNGSQTQIILDTQSECRDLTKLGSGALQFASVAAYTSPVPHRPQCQERPTTGIVWQIYYGYRPADLLYRYLTVFSPEGRLYQVGSCPSRNQWNGPNVCLCRICF